MNYSWQSKARIRTTLRILLVLLILISYGTFIFLDMTHNSYKLINSKYVKYASIIFCVLLSQLIDENYIYKTDKYLLQIGLLFTLIADTFLVILEYNIPGILCFCTVQVIYIFRYDLLIHNKTKKSITYFKFNILYVLLLSIISSIISIINSNLETPILIIVSLSYAFYLLTSVYKAICTLESNNLPKRNSYFIFLGMLLFLLCDLNVGLSYISTNITQYINLTYITSFLIWVFYLPSQLFLCLSAYKTHP